MIASTYCPKCRTGVTIIQGRPFRCGCGYYTPCIRVIDIPSVDLQPVGQVVLWIRIEPEFEGRFGITANCIHALESPAGRQMERSYIRPVLKLYLGALIQAGKMDKEQEADVLRVLTTSNGGDVKVDPPAPSSAA